MNRLTVDRYRPGASSEKIHKRESDLSDTLFTLVDVSSKRIYAWFKFIVLSTILDSASEIKAHIFDMFQSPADHALSLHLKAVSSALKVRLVVDGSAADYTVSEDVWYWAEVQLALGGSTADLYLTFWDDESRKAANLVGQQTNLGTTLSSVQKIWKAKTAFAAYSSSINSIKCMWEPEWWTASPFFPVGEAWSGPIPHSRDCVPGIVLDRAIAFVRDT